MNKTCYLITAMFALAATQGCSDRVVQAPAPVVAPTTASATSTRSDTPAPLAQPGQDKSAPLRRTATLQCEDRKIVLEASCMSVDGERLLSCTRQSLSVIDSGSGKKLNTRDFPTAKADAGGLALVEDTFGEVSCVTTASSERFIVATMDNGGNCDECEWTEVYSWDGKLLGADRAGQTRPEAIAAAVKAAHDQKNPPKDTASFAEVYFLPMQK